MYLNGALTKQWVIFFSIDYLTSMSENIFIFKQFTYYRLYVTFTIVYFTKYK